ncbi:MAG: DNA repair protein RadA [Rickettsiales bacterium]
MSKVKTCYICQSCGAVHSKWSGRCEDCGDWNSLQEEVTSKFNKKATSPDQQTINLSFQELSATINDYKRIPTSLSELDRVLGGGLVPGSAILIGGDPGIGKSTLLLQLVSQLANNNLNCAYISGEESTEQIKLRAKRLNLSESPVKLLCSTNINDIMALLEKDTSLNLVVIDSIQTMYANDFNSAPGTVSQVKACSHELVAFAKSKGVIVLIVGHVTKDGQLAGPKVLEHMVDTVLYFEGERGHHFRILRAVKNRFGGINEIGVFEMQEMGLKQVLNPSELFLSSSERKASGSSVLASIEGTRPMLVEVQALIAPSYIPMPRRSVVGWDSNRLSMIIAVLSVRYGLNLYDKEVYLNVVGGLKINEPAADLAVACALLSSSLNIPNSSSSIIFGEIGLSGEIRKVSHSETRLKEAVKLGFTSAIVPFGTKFKHEKMQLHEIGHIKQLVDFYNKR